jgi:hypothetical protein
VFDRVKFTSTEEVTVKKKHRTLRRDLTKVISIRPVIEPGHPLVGGEHSKKELFEQLVNSYSEHLHMSERLGECSRQYFLYYKINKYKKVFIFLSRQLQGALRACALCAVQPGRGAVRLWLGGRNSQIVAGEQRRQLKSTVSVKIDDDF